jgi:hypothetical protein
LFNEIGKIALEQTLRCFGDKTQLETTRLVKSSDSSRWSGNREITDAPSNSASNKTTPDNGG